jgi:5'-3' exonuclease
MTKPAAPLDYDPPTFRHTLLKNRKLRIGELVVVIHDEH